MFYGSSGDMVLRRIAGRRSFTHIHERNAKILVGDKDEKRKIPCHGNCEGAV